RHVVYDLHAHIILTPKYRRKVMSERVHDLLETLTGEVCDRHEVTLESINTDNDHAHLLVSSPLKVELSRFIEAVKTNTSRAVRDAGFSEVTRALDGPAFWSPSYCVVSTGGAPLGIVRRYVEDQGKTPRGPGNPTWGKKGRS